MLIFDPPDTNPMVSMQKAAFPGKVTKRIREHRFVFDRLFDENCTQNDVFCDTSRPLINNVLDGYNATAFAYGATGCGKTHTISGTPEQPGIIFLTMKELFERIEELQDTKIVDVSLSYLEIYNETIRDLLVPSNHKPLILREDADKRISVSNLSSHCPENVQQVMDMILHGNQNRTMSPTEANATSSRSHAVLQINITQKARTAQLSESHTFATLSIIDLAGSERAAATRNRGERLIEGANINKSLLALGNCINALCDPRQKGHVPYRDSKLTRLLKFSLGGNCKTVMIVCVSPSSHHYDETLNTLKYADRAKKIKTKVVRNEHNLDRHVGSYLKMITEQRQEIEELRTREKTAIEAEVNKREKLRQDCIYAMKDAILNLDSCIEKQSQVRVQRSQCMARLRSLTNQISQARVWIDAYDKIFSELMVDDEESDINNENLFSKIREIESNARNLLNKLTQEQASLQEFYSSNLSDKQSIDSTISVLIRRLDETSGWTQHDSETFKAHCELQKTKYEMKLVEDSLLDIPIPGSLSSMTELYFNTILKLSNFREAAFGPENFYQELLPVLQELVTQGLSMLASSEFTNNSSLSLDVRDIIRPLPTLSTSSSSTSLSSASKRQSLPGRMRRPFASSKRHTVIIRSPMQRKPLKRVRWEDDGGNSSVEPELMEVDGSPTRPPGNSNSSLIEASTLKITFSPPRMPKLGPPKKSSTTSALREMNNADGDMSIDSLDGDKPVSGVKKFGVRGELKRRSLGNMNRTKRLSVLGMNKRVLNGGKIEKENVDVKTAADVGESPTKKSLGMPMRVTPAKEGENGSQ